MLNMFLLGQQFSTWGSRADFRLSAQLGAEGSHLSPLGWGQDHPTRLHSLHLLGDAVGGQVGLRAAAAQVNGAWGSPLLNAGCCLWGHAVVVAQVGHGGFFYSIIEWGFRKKRVENPCSRLRGLF